MTLSLNNIIWQHFSTTTNNVLLQAKQLQSSNSNEETVSKKDKKDKKDAEVINYHNIIWQHFSTTTITTTDSSSYNISMTLSYHNLQLTALLYHYLLLH